MQLEKFLRGVEVLESRGPAPAAVSGLHYDSRRIEAGNAFVAIRGEQADGNAFIPDALARGASLIVSDAARLPAPAAGHLLRVADARAALAQTAANWFHHPAQRLRLIGITGTNGKTTTALLIEAMLRASGWTTGLLGTIEYHIGSTVTPSPHTTPESYDLQALLAQMVEAGCTAAVMEVSSHALALERVWGCGFEVAVFTNLTQDHLDFHRNMERYRAAKRRLFQGLGAGPPQVAVVNADDPAAAAMIEGYPGEVLTYGFSREALLRATGLVNSPSGLEFRLHGPGESEHALLVRSSLLGRVNVLNLMAAIGAGLRLGLERKTAVAGAVELARVRGRFERVYAGQPFTVVVDYAHTPDALVNVLGLARELVRPAGGRVLVVFGCGGDRDRGKRPLMGRAAAQAADWVMLTSDNPRSEDPERILDAIAVGAPGAEREADRGQAIERALAQAKPGDIVVLAGKGHEQVQIVGDREIPFNDVEAARAGLRKLGWTR